jgi:hypothetical protein
MNGNCSEEEKLAGAMLDEIKDDEENEIVMQMVCRFKNWTFVEKTNLDTIPIRLNDKDLRLVKASKNKQFLFAQPAILAFVSYKSNKELVNILNNKTVRMVLYVAKDGDINTQLLIEKITKKVPSM